MLWDSPRGSIGAILLTQFGADNGVSAEDCLTSTGLAVAGLRAPGTQITPRQELVIVRNLIHHLGRGLGVAAGQRLRLPSLGVLSFGVMTSPTMYEGMRFGIQYVDLGYAFSELSLRNSRGETHIVAHPGDLPDELAEFAVEHDLAAIATILADALSADLELLAATFRHAMPISGDGLHRKVFGPAVRFGAAENALVLDQRVMEQGLPQADSRVRAVAEAQCRELLARRRGQTATDARVRYFLAERVGQRPSITEASAALGLSERTLRRKLAAEGTSYRELQLEVRHRTAEELLAIGLTVCEVAHRLGYSEPAAFTHAFKAWSGQPPSRRRARRPGAALAQPIGG